MSLSGKTLTSSTFSLLSKSSHYFDGFSEAISELSDEEYFELEDEYDEYRRESSVKFVKQLRK